ELENLVERMVILNPDSEITEEILPERFTGHKPRPLATPIDSMEIPEAGIDFNALVDQFETQLIERALDKAGGVKNKAATLLQIKRTTIVVKMKKKGMLE